MARILAISILLLVVYSWEDLKSILRRLAFKLLKRRPRPPLRSPPPAMSAGRHEGEKKGVVDTQVSILVILATVPIALVYIISQADNLFAKLAWIGGILVALAAIAITSEILLRRAQYATPLVGIVSLFAPMVAVMAETAYLPRKVLAKFALLLSLPVFAGLILKYLNGATYQILIPRLDILTVVLVGSLFLRIAVEFLEHYFHLYNLEKLFSYYRVALGIVLGAALLLD